MTKQQFAAIMHVAEIAFDKPLSKDQQLVYYSYLNDIPPDVLASAVGRAVVELKWFPKVSELRALAVEATTAGKYAPPAEAWQLAYRAIGKIDMDIEGSVERALKPLPEAVQKAVSQYGIRVLMSDVFDLYDHRTGRVRKKADKGAAMTKFVDIYRNIIGREAKRLMLGTVVKQPEAIPESTPQRLTQKVVAKIGVVPKEKK